MAAGGVAAKPFTASIRSNLARYSGARPWIRAPSTSLPLYTLCGEVGWKRRFPWSDWKAKAGTPTLGAAPGVGGVYGQCR